MKYLLAVEGLKISYLQLMDDPTDQGIMKILILALMFLATACNPELQKVGESSGDLVKYFKISSANGGIGDGVLIVAYIGDKRLLTFWIKQPSGKYAHTDVMIIKSPVHLYEVESVYSQTPNCKLNPDIGQPQYDKQLLIDGQVVPFNRDVISTDEAMKEKREIGC